MADPISPWDSATFELAKIAVTALAGAVVGALTAQGIAARNKLRDDQLKELRIISTSAAIAYGIAEAFIIIKGQHVKPLFDTWKREHDRWELATQTAGTAGTKVVFELTPEFRTLTPVKAAVDKLREQMFANIALAPSAIRLVNALDRSTDQHTFIISEMNKAIAGYKSQQKSKAQLVAVYFGLLAGTRTDASYPNMLRGLYEDTDNGIMFGKLLGDDLAEHWKCLAMGQPQHLRGKPVAVMEFSRAEREGLMPDPANFAGWIAPSLPVQPVPTLSDRIIRALNALSS